MSSIMLCVHVSATVHPALMQSYTILSAHGVAGMT